jgi:hypothetical protein
LTLWCRQREPNSALRADFPVSRLAIAPCVLEGSFGDCYVRAYLQASTNEQDAGRAREPLRPA